ncbi:refilin-A isoform X2 [Nomascus leucogenys]|uniref:refilin-A isoform X2 n=1 Tax=Nomascus leucogenys TaxID=61853 RepID=UPI00122D8385|nr:refilin-A isoform X2 [Nomascus leucogenys]
MSNPVLVLRRCGAISRRCGCWVGPPCPPADICHSDQLPVPLYRPGQLPPVCSSLAGVPQTQPPSQLPNPPASEMRPRMLPVFFGESIKVNPEPTHEIRCNSEVKYASEKHFQDKVFYAPVPTVTAYSETIVAAPNCTWRNYRSQLTLEPRPRALHFRSTTIIFPKHARSTFRTTLHCSLGRPSCWFTASVQLQLCQDPAPSLLGPATL